MAELYRGGLQTWQIEPNNLDKDSYLDGFSRARMFDPETDLKTVYNGVLSYPETFNKKVHAFFLGIGPSEWQRMKGLFT